MIFPDGDAFAYFFRWSIARDRRWRDSSTRRGREGRCFSLYSSGRKTRWWARLDSLSWCLTFRISKGISKRRERNVLEFTADGFFGRKCRRRPPKKDLKNLGERRCFSSVVVEGTPSIEQPPSPFPLCENCVKCTERFNGTWNIKRNIV